MKNTLIYNLFIDTACTPLKCQARTYATYFFKRQNFDFLGGIYDLSSPCTASRTFTLCKNWSIRTSTRMNTRRRVLNENVYSDNWPITRILECNRVDSISEFYNLAFRREIEETVT